MIDYYELLQISPNADTETIHRVYKFLAARLHPDNGRSGDAAKFQLVKSGYDILVHSGRRAEYDAARKRRPVLVQPLSSTIDFMDHLDGEQNRRVAVLAVLYYRRRTIPDFPGVNLAELEERMGFPRDYLNFTLWYLVKKKYVDRTDNATYSLTAEGVDFVENQRATVPILNGLLTSSSTVNEDAKMPEPEESSKTKTPAGRRAEKKDRRVGAPDLRIIKVERRRNTGDRRDRATGGEAA